MAGTNGPTAAGGATDAPNPDGSAAEKPAAGREAESAATAEDIETSTSKPGDAGGFSLDKDAQD